MEFDEFVPQLRKFRFRRFDQRGDFLFDLRGAFPTVDGCGLGEHIDAGG